MTGTYNMDMGFLTAINSEMFVNKKINVNIPTKADSEAPVAQ